MTLPARRARVTYARLAATRHTDPAEEDRGHRSVHEKRAREIWFLCRTYDAATALEWGLVNAVVERSELHAEVRRWTEGLAEFSDRRPPDFSGFR